MGPVRMGPPNSSPHGQPPMHKRLPLAVRLGCFPLLLLAGCGPPVTTARGQSSGPAAPKPPPNASPQPRPKEVPLAERLRSPLEDDRPLADKLRSPRETLNTLYYAVVLYDLFPPMIEDALASLTLDALRPRPPPETAPI